MKRIYLMFALAVLFLAGCGGEKKSGVKETDKAVKQEITVGIASELSTADVSQAMNNTAVEVMSQIGEGLYTFDTQGEVQPAIAKDFAKVSEDGLTYSIELRQDAKWSNGEAVTANDFEYSWKRTVAPETAAEQSYYFDGILNYKEIAAGDKEPAELGIKALSDYELEVTLERPMSYFPSMLAIPGFFPLNQEYVESQGDNYGLTSETTLFNGPFTMEGWDGANSEWTYKKNENYWDKENVFLDKINVNVMKETATAVNLFNAEQIDFVQIKGEYVAQESGNKALYIRDLPGTYYLSYNTKNDLLKNKKVRQAINYAIDSEKIAENVLNDGSSKSPGFVPKGFVNEETGKDFAEEAGDLKQVNLEKAKTLWAEGLKELGQTEGKLEILGSDTDNVKKISEYLQGALSETLEGLTVTVSSVPFQNRLELSGKGEFDAVIGGWTPVYADPVDFLNLFLGSNSNNYGQWDNAEYNELIKESGTTYATDGEKRWETLIKADQLLAEEVPVSPLYQITEVYLINQQLSNMELGPLGSPYFKPVKVGK